MFARHVTPDLLAALQDTPVVCLVGGRQTGKSTLVQTLPEHGHRAEYLTFDDPATLALASADPPGFVSGLPEAVILDEVQRVPDLFLPLKLAVDRDRRPGRFVLTGSAHVLLIPRISESLAGRMELLTLWPLSQGELAGAREAFIERLFGRAGPPTQSSLAEQGGDLIPRVVRGGYPEAVRRAAARSRAAWFSGFVASILQRDVRELADIERLADLPRLLQLLAARAGGLFNQADVSRDAGIPSSSLHRYLTLLEHVFLIVRVPAWYRNLGKRLVKSPKLLLSDTGLAASLLGLAPERLEAERPRLGALLESFVGMELLKQCQWSEQRPSLLHFRAAKGAEVDFVLEERGGSVAGVEVKAGQSVGPGDFRGLRFLADVLGRQFAGGVVLYTGDSVVPFGDKLAAWPIQSLWAP